MTNVTLAPLFTLHPKKTILEWKSPSEIFKKNTKNVIKKLSIAIYAFVGSKEQLTN